VSAGPFTLGPRPVGDGHPCFVIAEAGSNHDGSLDQARRLVDVAAAAGADAVKFQLFRAGRLYTRGAGRSEYLKLDRDIFEIIAAMEMPYEWLPVLAEHARGQGLEFMASPFDEESADRLDPFVRSFKIASYEMTHVPLVRHLAAKGKPLVMSTGTADLDEVATAVGEVAGAGAPPLALMQCTAAYPAPLDALNLRAVGRLKAAFGIPVGLSDHSRDPFVGPLAAVALGANLLEKHFTLDNALPGPDHRFAVEPAELRAMVERVRGVEEALGTGDKHVQPVEQELRRFARRAIFAARDIAAGEPFSRANLAVLRCGTLEPGLPPAALDALLGRRARRALAAQSPVRDDDCA
jgi:N,N'-diacetyllegionaminate synthase